MLVDSHVHLNSPDFSADLQPVLQRARAAGVRRFLCPGYDLASSQAAVALAAAEPEVIAAVGIHPHDAQSCNAEVAREIESFLVTHRARAVGETGLDYYYDHSPRDVQQQALRLHLQLARRHDEMEWVGPVRKALKEGRFVLYEQSILDLADPDGPPHFEILLRMRDEAGGLVPPMNFIPAAERYNLMPAIDRWVISAVLQELGKRTEAEPAAAEVLCAINLSGGSVTDAHLARFIHGKLAEHGVPGRCVCFEITETAAIGNLAHAVQLMSDLKRIGCRFSLDDFGSGMSSFAYLKRLPVDFVKIDGEFVRDMVTGEITSRLGDAVVLATGGYGNVFYLSTNAKGCNATAIWRAYKRGAAFGNPCYTQIHPTCIPVTGEYQSKLTLMSESLRNDGRIWVPQRAGDTRPPREIPEAVRD